MPSDIAISVKNVSKTFKIPHEKVSSIRGAFVRAVKNTFPRRDAISCVSSESVFPPLQRGGVPSAGRRGSSSPSPEPSEGYNNLCPQKESPSNASSESFQALDNVSFEIKKGEFFGIIGRNGSGKSTLLKILANIYRPDKGHVKINGMISPFLELGIGFNPELSGRDNVYLNATVLGMTQKQIDEKFDSIVAFSELERFIDQKLKNYSSGMQVRLAFSVSIHANRDILLMDEVLAVGDSNFQSKCLEEFNKYRDAGRTVVIVTHDISVVQRYCDRALLLRNGKIEKIGKPDDVATKYIYDNMSDEEKRLVAEEKRQQEELAHTQKKQSQEEKKRQEEEQRKKEEERKNKVAEITKVEFLDKDGKVKNVFQTGDDITARIYYFATKKIIKPVFGVALHAQEGIHISGPNTKTSKLNIDKIDGKGFIDFIIVHNNFFSGKFNLSVVICDWNFTIPFDFKDRCFDFQVLSEEENQYGIIKLEHVWKK